MATIKSYTDLEQSRKLAEILPLESADMKILSFGIDIKRRVVPIDDIAVLNKEDEIPCWSIAALLGVLPNNIGRYTKSLYWFDDAWHCEYVDEDGEGYVGETADNLVDACFEMIIKLHKMNLL